MTVTFSIHLAWHARLFIGINNTALGRGAHIHDEIINGAESFTGSHRGDSFCGL
jgi:hypothetical protein